MLDASPFHAWFQLIEVMRRVLLWHSLLLPLVKSQYLCRECVCQGRLARVEGYHIMTRG